MRQRFIIRDVEISARMVAKLGSKHGVAAHEVYEACEAPERAGWHDHPEYGRRLLVEGRTYQGRLLKVVLQPVDASEGKWRLRTALASKRGGGAS